MQAACRPGHTGRCVTILEAKQHGPAVLQHQSHCGRLRRPPQGLSEEETHAHHPRLKARSALPGSRRLELISTQPLRNGAVAMHYRRAH
jgi:hypothetical protein